MANRINIPKTQPEAYKAMLALDKYMSATEISSLHKELIKIRASQINGCAYCINMHTKDAKKYGETDQRLHLISAWRETDFFSEEERTMLAMTEEITLITQRGLTEETYQKAIELFGEVVVAQIIMAIVSINAWNRIGVATHLKPALDKVADI